MFGINRLGPRCAGSIGSSWFQLNQVNQHPCEFGVTKKKTAYIKGSTNPNAGFSNITAVLCLSEKHTEIFALLDDAKFIYSLRVKKVNGLFR